MTGARSFAPIGDETFIGQRALGLRERINLVRVEHPRETEVKHLDKILAAPDPPEMDVGRLDVSMHQAACVRLLERIADLAKHMNHARRRQGAVLAHQ